MTKDRIPDRDVADDASGAAAGAVTGGVVGGAAGLAASLMGLAIPGIGPIIAAGPIVATLSGAGVGAVAGWLVSKAMRADDDQSVVANIVVGILGAAAGGFLSRVIFGDKPAD